MLDHFFTLSNRPFTLLFPTAAVAAAVPVTPVVPRRRSAVSSPGHFVRLGRLGEDNTRDIAFSYVLFFSNDVEICRGLPVDCAWFD